MNQGTDAAQRLTLIEENVGRTNGGHVLGRYLCKCGAEHVVSQSRVRNGYTKSCGCYAREQRSARSTTHGMRKSPEYSSWAAMKARCLNKSNKDYPSWGGAGIGVCDRWADSFEAFYADMGDRPENTTLDRFPDPKGDYEPGNCRWATPKQQMRNRRDSVVVKTDRGVIPLVDYAAQLGITNGAAHLRLKRGTLEGVSYE